VTLDVGILAKLRRHGTIPGVTLSELQRHGRDFGVLSLALPELRRHGRDPGENPALQCSGRQPTTRSPGILPGGHY
jgi:hypothetical protein